MPKKRAASAATGTSVDKNPERELDVFVWVFEPALFVSVDWKLRLPKCLGV
jgi:hypothetical protein